MFVFSVHLGFESKLNLLLLPFHLQSHVCVGHMSADHSGLHGGGSLGGSLPHPSGLGQAVAGEHTMELCL